MKKILLFLFLLISANMFSQSTWGSPSDDQYNTEVRQKLNLDYSMPDYQTGKIDPKVMGPRLASILQELVAKYKRSDYLSILSMIQADQIEGLDYCTIEKLGLENVTKSGNTITIRFKTTLNKNPLNIKKSDLTVFFVEGVSESKYANSLFMTISKYMKE